MNAPFSYAIWVTKPGCEDDFVVRWRDLAHWTTETLKPKGWARLLQDKAQPNRFVSLGPWESFEAIEAWRAHPGFKERISRLHELLESFAPATLESRVEIGVDEAKKQRVA